MCTSFARFERLFACFLIFDFFLRFARARNVKTLWRIRRRRHVSRAGSQRFTHRCAIGGVRFACIRRQQRRHRRQLSKRVRASSSTTTPLQQPKRAAHKRVSRRIHVALQQRRHAIVDYTRHDTRHRRRRCRRTASCCIERRIARAVERGTLARRRVGGITKPKNNYICYFP